MRTAVVIALIGLFAVGLANPVAQQQKDDARRWESGLFCHVCKDIATEGESIGAAYSKAWLEIEVKNKCAHELVMDRKCKEDFGVEMDLIDQKILAKEDPGYICIDTNFC